MQQLAKTGTESLLLALAGGAAGLLVARWGGYGLPCLMVANSQATPLNVEPDATVLACVIGLSIVAGVASGLGPAIRATRVSPGARLTRSEGLGRRDRLARGTLAAQIALSAVLLHATGLFLRTAWNLDAEQLGFNRDGLLLFEIDPERSGYKGADGIDLHRRLLEAIRQTPGVRSATFSQHALLSGAHNSTPTGTDGAGPRQTSAVLFNRVGPRFVDTMGMQLVLGRDIDWRDSDVHRPTALVSESWARAYFPGQNPVGRRVGPSGLEQSLWGGGAGRSAAVVRCAEGCRQAGEHPVCGGPLLGGGWYHTKLRGFALELEHP